jgi:O-acetyl-ADP-ribose deacetylase (regulator of RNase III)
LKIDFFQVDGAIHKAAGPGLVQECALLGGCEVGDAKITGAHKLPCKFVVHTVGPIGEKPKLLKNCYDSCLELVLEYDLKTIALCGISTGIYGNVT